MVPRGTPLRNVRVEDDLWQTAATVANERQESLSEVVRRLLRGYVRSAGIAFPGDFITMDGSGSIEVISEDEAAQQLTPVERAAGERQEL